MNVQSTRNKAMQMINTIGRAALSSQYPNDFEVYLCSLELTTADGETIDFFTFPVMPSSISKTENKRTSIKNTAGGIVTLTSPIYTPSDINIKGNFGQCFKILIGSNDSKGAQGVAFSTSNGVYDLTQLGQKKKALTLKTPAFDFGIKNGYGATRLLKAIVSKSNGVDENGRPFKLFFYNMAFGESYLVVVPPNGITFSQNEQKNMIWEYSLNMTVVAPLESVKNETNGKSLVKSLLVPTIQKSINDVASYVAGVL